jgi:uncharacterized protein YndB with AHSA1/START domain
MAEYEPVKVSRSIQAEPAAIFAFLSDPARHHEFDGSGMLRTAASNSVITRVGDEFTMNMFFEGLGGDYQMLNRVVEFEPDRLIGWEPAPGDVRSGGSEEAIGERVGTRWSYELSPDASGRTTVTEIYDFEEAPEDLRKIIDDARFWKESMVKTLAKLDELCGEGTAA